MVAVDLRLRSANALQRRWCAELLARLPLRLSRMRAKIEQTEAWLAAHPTRTLHEAYRERLLRYQTLLDAHGAGRARSSAPRRAAKPLPRQLALLPESASKEGRRT